MSTSLILMKTLKTVIFKLDDLGSTEIITPFMLRPGDEKVIKAGKREYQIRLVLLYEVKFYNVYQYLFV
jgi:hypothetical protein